LYQIDTKTGGGREGNPPKKFTGVKIVVIMPPVPISKKIAYTRIIHKSTVNIDGVI